MIPWSCGCHSNAQSESYICRPFNFFVNPNSEPKFGLDREYVVQASAIGFLLESGFNFNSTYTSGIRYLSRREERYVIERENRLAQELKEDIHIDDASQQFVWSNPSSILMDLSNLRYSFSPIGQGLYRRDSRMGG